MATGRLAVVAIPATALTTVYTVPTGFYTVCNISLTNRNTTAVKVRVAMASSSTPSLQEYLEYDTVIIPNGVFERTGLVMNAAINIVVFSDTANIGCTVYGIETSST